MLLEVNRQTLEICNISKYPNLVFSLPKYRQSLDSIMLKSFLVRAHVLMKLTAVGASEALSTVLTSKQSRHATFTHFQQIPTNTAIPET